MTKYKKTKTIAMTKGRQKVSILSLCFFLQKEKKTVTEKRTKMAFLLLLRARKTNDEFNMRYLRMKDLKNQV